MAGQEAYKEALIDDKRFRVMMLPPEEAEDLFLDVIKHVGPAGMAFFSEAKGLQDLKSVLAMNVGNPALLAVVREFVDRIDKPAYHRMRKLLAGVSMVKMADNSWPIVENVDAEIFRGRIGLRFKWLWFALKVQYPDFLSDLAGAASAFAPARQDEASSSTSHRGSDGASGDS